MNSLPKARRIPFEARRVERVPILVPATMLVNGHASPVRVVNITQYGALLETAASVGRRSCMTIQCGRLDVEAVVIWVMTGHVGIRFLHEQTYATVAELIARHDAVRAIHHSPISLRPRKLGDS